MDQEVVGSALEIAPTNRTGTSHGVISEKTPVISLTWAFSRTGNDKRNKDPRFYRFEIDG